jgi:Protein of unknown function (DUF3631)
MTQGYPDGHRTHELTRRAGWCLGPQKMSETQTLDACVSWNQHNHPPLPEEKVRSTVASIARSETRKRETTAQSTTGVVPSLSTIEPEPQATFRWLSALSPVDYDRARIQEAEKLGIRVGTLDDEVDKFRPDCNAKFRAGRALVLPTPEPWPESVEGPALLAELASGIICFVVLPWESAVASALWIVHAYVFEAFSISPRLAITAPEKQCGKTTLLSLIEALVPKPLLASNITAAATFRAIEEWKPTLLIDEADTFLGENNELRGVLNSGHRRNGQVIRTVSVGDSHELGLFSTFCPIAIASIGKLPSTLEDRSVVISMRRALPDERFSRFDQMAADALAPLASRAKRWADDNLETLGKSDPEVPAELHGRAADNWRPLLAIADLAGDGWPRWARKAAISLSARGDDGSVRIQLLTDIRVILDERNVDRISSAELVQALCTIEGRPWQDWKAGRPITANQLARQLAPFGIKPKTMRITKEPVKGYDRSDFTDAFTRYLPQRAPAEQP